MDFEGNVLSEPSQRRPIPYDLTYICNPKKGGEAAQRYNRLVVGRSGRTEVGKTGESSQNIKLPVTT